MKKQIYLHIPEPCHENWDAMTPVQQGRFCKSCSKAVVDFSNMSDKQILELLSKASGSTCGRFRTEQLERPMVKEIPPMLKPYKFLLSAFIPAMITSAIGNAQGKLTGKVAATHRPVCTAVTGDTIVSVRQTQGEVIQQSTREKRITGKMTDELNHPLPGAIISVKGNDGEAVANSEGEFELIVSNHSTIDLEASYVGYETKKLKIGKNSNGHITLRMKTMVSEMISINDDYFPPLPAKVDIPGRILNEQGEPIPYATIKFKRKNIVADSNGKFSINVRENKRHVELTASAVGYETTTTIFNAEENGTDTIPLKLKNNVVLNEVVVVAYPKHVCRWMSGGVSVVKQVTVMDTTKTFIKKMLGTEMFKAYPNPVAKDETLTLTFKKAGDYTIQLFDNAGKLYVSRSFSAGDAKQPLSLPLPAEIVAGAYYIKAINTASQKQFVEKIIVR